MCVWYALPLAEHRGEKRRLNSTPVDGEETQLVLRDLPILDCLGTCTLVAPRGGYPGPLILDPHPRELVDLLGRGGGAVGVMYALRGGEVSAVWT